MAVLPVFAAIPAHWTQGMVFDKSAVTAQLTETIRRAALLVGGNANITAHDLRRGAARDMAKLQKAGHKTMHTSASLRASLGHSTKSAAINAAYIGCDGDDHWSVRLDHQSLKQDHHDYKGGIDGAYISKNAAKQSDYLRDAIHRASAFVSLCQI